MQASTGDASFAFAAGDHFLVPSHDAFVLENASATSDAQLSFVVIREGDDSVWDDSAREAALPSKRRQKDRALSVSRASYAAAASGGPRTQTVAQDTMRGAASTVAATSAPPRGTRDGGGTGGAVGVAAASALPSSRGLAWTRSTRCIGWRRTVMTTASRRNAQRGGAVAVVVAVTVGKGTEQLVIDSMLSKFVSRLFSQKYKLQHSACSVAPLSP